MGSGFSKPLCTFEVQPYALYCFKESQSFVKKFNDEHKRYDTEMYHKNVVIKEILDTIRKKEVWLDDITNLLSGCRDDGIDLNSTPPTQLVRMASDSEFKTYFQELTHEIEVCNGYLKVLEQSILIELKSKEDCYPELSVSDIKTLYEDRKNKEQILSDMEAELRILADYVSDPQKLQNELDRLQDEYNMLDKKLSETFFSYQVTSRNMTKSNLATKLFGQFLDFIVMGNMTGGNAVLLPEQPHKPLILRNYVLTNTLYSKLNMHKYFGDIVNYIIHTLRQYPNHGDTANALLELDIFNIIHDEYKNTPPFVIEDMFKKGIEPIFQQLCQIIGSTYELWGLPQTIERIFEQTYICALMQIYFPRDHLTTIYGYLYEPPQQYY